MANGNKMTVVKKTTKGNDNGGKAPGGMMPAPVGHPKQGYGGHINNHGSQVVEPVFPQN